MLERIVENWLTSLNERQYQIPFCQLLQAEGDRVIYISPHGQLELGIDVLTLDASETPRAYQLKRGDISLAEWRKNEGEIVQLVEYDPSNPALPPSTERNHQSFIVTNGTFSDPVLNAINQRNTTWAPRGYGPLIPIAKDDLVSRFLRAHGHYFPVELEEVSRFLELYIEAGSAPLDKNKFSLFLAAVLPAAHTIEKRHALQAASSIVLFTSYILKNKTLADNHWAIFEAWIMAGAYIMTMGEEREDDWQFSLELCQKQATNALAAMAREAAAHPHLTQGSPFSDGTIYHFRRTIMCGLLSAFYLVTENDENFTKEREIARDFFEKHGHKSQLWGESAVPMVFASLLALENTGKQSLAEQIAGRMIYTICKANGKGGDGLPNPYWGPERCLRRTLGLGRTEVESFNKFSYTLESLVGYLARRWRRVMLRTLWEPITRIDFARSSLVNESEWFRWQSKTAALTTRPPNQPQSWRALREESENLPIESVPRLLRKYRAFLIYFTLVYPHRFEPSMARAIEQAAWS